MRDASAANVAQTLGDLVDEADRGSLTGEFAEFMAANGHEGLRDWYLGWLDDDLLAVRPPHLARRPRSDGAIANGEWLAAHIPTACAHLLPEHGHLSLAVGSFGGILDEMVGR